MDRKNIRQKRTFGILRHFRFTSFPVNFDTNGLVVREAAACATPSLLVRGSCAAEGVEDCKTGFLCMESAHSIKATLDNIMDNKALLKEVGKKHKAIFISADDAVKSL